jgi:phenylacetate-CoA ligase
MTVSDNEYGNDRIVVKVGINQSTPFDTIKDLKDHFRARIRVAPEIEICPVDEIQQTTSSATNRKPTKFIDNRTK